MDMGHVVFMLLCTLIGCGASDKDSAGNGDGGGDEGGGDEGGGDEGGGDEGGDETTSPATFLLTNFFDGSVVVDATVESVLDSTVTDASGSATVSVPVDEIFEVTLTHPAYFPVRWFGKTEYAETAALIAEEPLVAGFVADSLANAFGTTVDSALGHVIISSLTPIGGGPETSYLSGIELTLDVEYELAVAQDGSAPGGFASSSTSADGVNIFMNVAPGPVTLSVVPPDGFTRCNLFAYDTGPHVTDFHLEVSAETVTRATVTCLTE